MVCNYQLSIVIYLGHVLLPIKSISVSPKIQRRQGAFALDVQHRLCQRALHEVGVLLVRVADVGGALLLHVFLAGDLMNLTQLR